LTISLAWHGVMVVRNSRAPQANRKIFDVALQAIVIIAALNCAIRGYLIAQPLMMLIATIGVASGITNLWYSFSDKHKPLEHVREHVKSSVGAGISVYTAFLAFGAVRLIPEHVFNPALWSAPTIIGISIILYFQRRFSASRPIRS